MHDKVLARQWIQTQDLQDQTLIPLNRLTDFASFKHIKPQDLSSSQELGSPVPFCSQRHGENMQTAQNISCGLPDFYFGRNLQCGAKKVRGSDPHWDFSVWTCVGTLASFHSAKNAC